MSDDQDYAVRNTPIPETPPPGQAPKPWAGTSVVGRRIPRVDGYERVSGGAVYPSDVVLPDMLYGAMLRCPHPHARVKRVDVSAAAAMDGVRAVIAHGMAEAATPWSFNDFKTSLFPDVCRYEGEPVAAVAADSPYLAWDAVRAIRVDYEVLPHVSDLEAALAPDAPRIHETGNVFGQPEVYARGDVAAGFAQADVVLERTYRSACEMQVPIEPHGCVARWEGDSLTVWESTQGVYAVQSKIAETLKLPLSKVRVIGHYMGGGFGSKLRAGRYTIACALLARKAARPVKLFLTREETLLATGNRPASTMRLKAGVRKDGSLTALEFVASGESGAYPAGGTAILDWLVRDTYLCANVRTSVTDVAVNAGPARPFRAPGHPQCSWALEQMLDELAAAIAMDPVELRLKNIPQVSQAREGNPAYTTTGLAECLRQGAKAFGWPEARAKAKAASSGHLKRGVGLAGCLWIVGGGRPPSTVILKLFSDGSCDLNMGASDIGTGTKTVMALVVAEELGVHPARIHIENADTGTTQYATPSGGSKTVPTEGPAVRDAAVQVKRQLLELAAAELEAKPEELRLEPGRVAVAADPARSVAITAIKAFARRGVIVGVGYRGPNPENRAISSFGAQFCEVEVDSLTGESRLLRFVAAHDSGRVMDRLTYDSQVLGGIVMGAAFATTEARILDAGRSGKLLNRNWHDYKLPTALDAPLETVSVPVEMPDAEANTIGAKGLGEPVTVPTAAAIANAVADALGLRFPDTPITPARVLALLAAGEGRSPS